MAATDWHLRPAQPADDAFLHALYLQVHAQEFAAMPLPPDRIATLLHMQAQAQKLGYLRDYPTATGFIIQIAAEPAGRLLLHWSPTALHLIDIALTPAHQARGLGTQILKDLIAQAAARRLPIHLSVSPLSPALRLYTRLGFQVTAGGVMLHMQLNPSGQPAPEPEPGPAPEPGLTSTFYTRLLHRTFQLDGSPQTLRLHHVATFGPGSFTLLFHGPLTPVLPQQIFTLHLLSPQGTPESTVQIFLVPIGPQAGAMQYEAVYNR